jgi:outer membrane protein assembly factor BamB
MTIKYSSRTSFTRLLFSLLTMMLIVSSNYQLSAQDKDWSQWMGPERNSIWKLDLQKESLQAKDLNKLWEAAVGTGYSGPTAANGKVYLMDLLGDKIQKERVLCIDAETGEELWIHEYEVDYSIGYPTGPRASVLIQNKKAYSFGTMGDLYCLDASSGNILWYVDGEMNYKIDYPIWGLAASPLIENDMLIIQMGGKPDACLVAFHKDTGKEIWRSLSDEASYSSPIIIDQAGKRVLVCWTGDNLAGMNPATGAVYWKIPYERKKSIINISTPVYSPPYIFLSSFYDGSMLIELDENDLRAELIWERAGESERKTDALHCIISTPFIQDDYVYGVDSYGELRCLDLMTGDRIWTDSTLVPFGRWSNAHFVRQNDKVWAFNEKGELVLGEYSPAGFNDLGRVELIKPVPVSPNPRGGVNWSFPAFSGRRIYARSDALLVCYELVK